MRRESRRDRAGARPQCLQLVLFLDVGDGIRHFLEGTYRISLVRSKLRAFGQVLQQHDHGFGYSSELPSIGADPAEDFGLGFGRA